MGCLLLQLIRGDYAHAQKQINLQTQSSSFSSLLLVFEKQIEDENEFDGRWTMDGKEKGTSGLMNRFWNIRLL